MMACPTKKPVLVLPQVRRIHGAMTEIPCFTHDRRTLEALLGMLRDTNRDLAHYMMILFSFLFFLSVHRISADRDGYQDTTGDALRIDHMLSVSSSFHYFHSTWSRGGSISLPGHRSELETHYTTDTTYSRIL